MGRVTVFLRMLSQATALMPSLRIVGLVYAGLGGMLATVLVVSVALVPVVPALRLAAEPINKLTEPASQVITTLLRPSPAYVEVPQHPAAVPTAAKVFSPLTSIDVTIVGDLEEAPMVVLPPVLVATLPRPASVIPDDAILEPELVLEVESPEVSSPHALAAVVEPETDQQIAIQAAPRALPTLAAATETPLQAKARRNVENQAAIDAAHAAQASARAEANAANQAAIDAAKITRGRTPSAATPTPKR